MPYIERDASSHIIATFATEQAAGQEWADTAELWVDPKQVIKDQIDALERQQMMPRATREFMLLFMESNFTPSQLSANPGYQAVKAFDSQIAALRAQL